MFYADWKLIWLIYVRDLALIFVRAISTSILETEEGVLLQLSKLFLTL
jgi:hypothetical protein